MRLAKEVEVVKKSGESGELAKFAHLVNRSAIGKFEAANQALCGSGESSLLNAEQLRQDQVTRDRGTVHANECA